MFFSRKRKETKGKRAEEEERYRDVIMNGYEGGVSEHREREKETR